MRHKIYETIKIWKVRLYGVKSYIAGIIITFVIYLCFEENIVKNSFYKEIIEQFLLFNIILYSIFNLVLIKLGMGTYDIEIGLFTIILLVYLYIFFIMYKKKCKKKDKNKKFYL